MPVLCDFPKKVYENSYLIVSFLLECKHLGKGSSPLHLCDCHKAGTLNELMYSFLGRSGG